MTMRVLGGTAFAIVVAALALALYLVLGGQAFATAHDGGIKWIGFALLAAGSLGGAIALVRAWWCVRDGVVGFPWPALCYDGVSGEPGGPG